LDREPLLALLLAPLLARTPLPFAEEVGLQRAPEAGRGVAGRVSELERRAGRALGRLPFGDCAGLRSLELVAGRLK
jgi:hypothetical protein